MRETTGSGQVRGGLFFPFCPFLLFVLANGVRNGRIIFEVRKVKRDNGVEYILFLLTDRKVCTDTYIG
jgi:hypothetical protein